MSPSENAAIAALSAEIRGYHADLIEFRERAEPALAFYASIVGVSRFLKWGVGIGAGIATIFGSLRVLGVV
jgi:hypothetical protein